MAKNLEYAVMLDVYGDMLTEKQKNVLELYYDEDLSLAEIAEHEGISRQGVRDSIKRGEEAMCELEEKLGMIKKSQEAAQKIKSIRSKFTHIADELGTYNMTKHYAEKLHEIISLFDELI